MPYRICKIFEVENGHLLSKHPEDCRFPHGHTRRIELVLEADTLDENQMVCDFKVVKKAVGDYIRSLDHSLCVNTKDRHYGTLKKAFGDHIIPFEGVDPTTEVIAKTIYDKLGAALERFARNGKARSYRLRRTVRVLRVRVWETSSCWAEFGAE